MTTLQREPVFVGIDGHGADTHFRRSAHDTDGDFRTVGDQEFAYVWHGSTSTGKRCGREGNDRLAVVVRVARFVKVARVAMFVKVAMVVGADEIHFADDGDMARLFCMAKARTVRRHEPAPAQ